MTDSQYLIEYRNSDGSLLLPQYGGCWHTTQPSEIFIVNKGSILVCRKCRQCTKPGKVFKNPNLATPQGFFDLWEAMQKREDWDCFCFDFSNRYIPHSGRFCALVSELVNPITFPALVRGYLESP